MRMVLLIPLLLLINLTHAQESFIPTDENYVIANWKVDTKGIAIEYEIANLLNEAKYPGNSNYYAQAAVLIATNQEKLVELPQFLYYQALTLQYYHKFAQSADLLKQLLHQNPAQANARLLLSNIYAVQGYFSQAKAMCSALLGRVEMLVIAACKLNIDAQQGNLKDVKTALETLSKFAVSNPTQSIDTTIYIDEIRASMATYIKDFYLADKILSTHIGDKAPVSFWVLWADIQLALNRPSAVLSALGFIVSETKNQDDSLLLRLALAEKALDVTHTEWLPKVIERMKLRELRLDEEHAFDIALYYMHIKNNAQVALKWANVNWQQAKLKEDAFLIAQIEDSLDTEIRQTQSKAETP